MIDSKQRIDFKVFLLKGFFSILTKTTHKHVK